MYKMGCVGVFQLLLVFSKETIFKAIKKSKLVFLIKII